MMDRKEAIKIFQQMKKILSIPNSDAERTIEALDMAIEALSAEAEQGGDAEMTGTPTYMQQSRHDDGKDLISRADAIEAIESRQTEQWIDADVDYNNGLESAVAEIKALPSAETHEIRTETHGVCSDLISRADAIEELGEYFDHLKRIDKRGIKRIEPISLDCKGIINELPLADRPGGEWKPVSEGLPQSVGSYIVTCKDEQGWVYVDYDFWTVADKFKYNRDKVTAWIPFPKPYCVAEMKGEK